MHGQQNIKKSIFVFYYFDFSERNSMSQIRSSANILSIECEVKVSLILEVQSEMDRREIEG
jgi:hypothetical protein